MGQRLCDSEHQQPPAVVGDRGGAGGAGHGVTPLPLSLCFSPSTVTGSFVLLASVWAWGKVGEGGSGGSVSKAHLQQLRGGWSTDPP